MRLLDLYCSAGGAAEGYRQAGFDHIVGIDNMPQPNYPFDFIRGDLAEDDELWRRLFDDEDCQYDLIHASPPCQAYSTLRHTNRDVDYPDLVDATRRKLDAGRTPYVIENVPGAPLRDPVELCGSMFNLQTAGYELRRHRLFECSFPLQPPACRHTRPVLGVYGDLSRNQRPSTRGTKAGIRQAEQLMGINWMTPQELVQAVPPAYTRFIGEQFVAGR